MSSGDTEGGRTPRAFIRNEFSVVRIEWCTDERRGSLRIEVPSTDQSIVLDPLELEALTKIDRVLLRELLVEGDER
ncbi:hypothetical protein [Actinophytocola sp.]|uniref:hypothetical protein n=1 Tax=Actinophytocola sp. TaxID=1872138 RepID=UPI003D6BA749